MDNITQFAHRTSDTTWQGECPVCKHRDLTLHIAKEGKNTSLRCDRGCDIDAIIEALGLQWADLYPDKTDYRKAVARYGPLNANPLEVEKMVLTLYAESRRAGKTLSLYDEARAKVAAVRVYGQ